MILKRQLDTMYPVECNEHEDVMQAFQLACPGRAYGLRVEPKTMPQYMAVLLKHGKGSKRFRELLSSFSKYLDENKDLSRRHEMEALRNAVIDVMRSDERQRMQVLGEMQHMFPAPWEGDSDRDEGGGGESGGGAMHVDGSWDACLRTLEARLRRLEVLR